MRLTLIWRTAIWVSGSRIDRWNTGVTLRSNLGLEGVDNVVDAFLGPL